MTSYQCFGIRFYCGASVVEKFQQQGAYGDECHQGAYGKPQKLHLDIRIAGARYGASHCAESETDHGESAGKDFNDYENQSDDDVNVPKFHLFGVKSRFLSCGWGFLGKDSNIPRYFAPFIKQNIEELSGCPPYFSVSGFSIGWKSIW